MPLPAGTPPTAPPESGVFVAGLHLSGARWDAAHGALADAAPGGSGAAHAPCPLIHFIPVMAESTTDEAYAERIANDEAAPSAGALLRLSRLRRQPARAGGATTRACCPTL